MGRKSSEINFPFEAKKKDLPALPSSEKEGDDDGDVEQFDWKKHLSRCVRLTRKKAAAFGE